MIIINKVFKGASELHAYLRERAGFIEATKEEKEAWNYDTPLWTSPSNFIGCDLIYGGEEVGAIIGVYIRKSFHKKSTNKVISLETESGYYKFSNSSVRFKNALYDGGEQVLSLHPSRGGAHMWSRGFVINEKDYKALYYITEEYQNRYKKTMVKRHGVDRPYKSVELKEKARKSIHDKYGVDWFLKRGSHYSSITETMLSKYGVQNIIHSSDFLERCGQCTSKGEQEMVNFLVDEMELNDSMYYTTGETIQAVIVDHETHGSYQVDFINERLGVIVEFFGDYWHCNPKTYDKNYIHETNGKRAEEIWKADKKRVKRMKELTGHEVIVVWESDWNNRKELEKKRLKRSILSLSSRIKE